MAVVNAKLALLFVSLAASGCLRPVQGYAGGAPTEVCEDMLPQHGAPVQTTESPYTLTPNRKTVRGGDSITLTLAARDQSKFKGFMVQARDGAENPIGSFAPLPASKNNNEFKGKWKLISCPKGPSNVSTAGVWVHDVSAFASRRARRNAESRARASGNPRCASDAVG